MDLIYNKSMEYLKNYFKFSEVILFENLAYDFNSGQWNFKLQKMLGRIIQENNKIDLITPIFENLLKYKFCLSLRTEELFYINNSEIKSDENIVLFHITYFKYQLDKDTIKKNSRKYLELLIKVASQLLVIMLQLCNET